MRELSLFSGAGGGLLGTKLLGFKHIGYVEYNDYCQRVIAQRIKDGILDEAPIFGDIRTFISEGFAGAYKDLVDILTAGFPCQPFSQSGKQLAEEDQRNMWPSTIQTIKKGCPRFILLENVVGLLDTGYIFTVIADLFEANYDISPPIKIGANFVDGNIIRERIFILAEPSCFGLEKCVPEIRSNHKFNDRKANPLDFNSAKKIIRNGLRWPTEGGIFGVADGLAHWMDRIKASGNGQYPKVVETVWRLMGPQ